MSLPSTFIVPFGHRLRPLYDQIAQVKSLITAATNPAHVAQYRQQLPGLQQQLVDAAMAEGVLMASEILGAIPWAYNAGANASY
jgi:hypothetical protein